MREGVTVFEHASELLGLGCTVAVTRHVWECRTPCTRPAGSLRQFSEFSTRPSLDRVQPRRSGLHSVS